MDGKGFSKYVRRGPPIRATHRFTGNVSFLNEQQELTSRDYRFSKKYGFEKPNDRRAIELMNAAAVEVVRQFVDVVVAYGQSDEFR